MDDKDYAELVKKYGEEVVLNGYEDFEKHLRDRKNGLDKLIHEKTKQDILYSQFNRENRTNRSYDHQSRLKQYNKEKDTDETQIAKKHGAKEPEKEDITKEEKNAQAKENFEKDSPVEETKLKEPEKEKDYISDKQEKFVEAIGTSKQTEVDDERERKLQEFIKNMQAIDERKNNLEKER